MKPATCFNCGKTFTDIKQLHDIRAVGLAYFGTCPDCGHYVGCQSIWPLQRVIDIRANKPGGL